MSNIDYAKIFHIKVKKLENMAFVFSITGDDICSFTDVLDELLINGSIKDFIQFCQNRKYRCYCNVVPLIDGVKEKEMQDMKDLTNKLFVREKVLFSQDDSNRMHEALKNNMFYEKYKYALND